MDSRYEKYKKYIKEYRLMDNAFMIAYFNEQPELIKYVIKTILGRNDLKIIRSELQKPFENLHGRSVIFDIDAENSEGCEFDIEVERSETGASSERAR